jgi:hypothetical protein
LHKAFLKGLRFGPPISCFLGYFKDHKALRKVVIYPVRRESRIELSMQEYLNIMETVSQSSMIKEFHMRID